jgi:hypothetical protein
MIFSEICVSFHQLAVETVRSEHPEQLGSFLLAAFEPFNELTGTDQRYAKALGREVLAHQMQHLVQHEPERLGELATRLQDKAGNSLQRKRGVCFNSDLVKLHMAPAVMGAYSRLWPLTVGGFLRTISQQLKAAHTPKKFSLYRPLARQLIMDLEPEKLGTIDDADRDALQDAWMLVKKRSHAPLWGEGPKTQPSAPEPPQAVPVPVAAPPLNTPKPEPQMVEPDPVPEPSPSETEQFDDIDAFLAMADEDVTPEDTKAETGRRIDIVREGEGLYEHIVSDDFEPAFVAGIEHPRHGKLLTMVSCHGFNSEGQLVYRGGLMWVHQASKEITHRYMAEVSVIDSVDWKDDEGTACCARAIRWFRGGYGKYWTNIKPENSRWGDVESLKRWFRLGTFPEIIWMDEAEYNRYRRRFRQQLQRAEERCS